LFSEKGLVVWDDVLFEPVGSIEYYENRFMSSQWGGGYTRVRGQVLGPKHSRGFVIFRLVNATHAFLRFLQLISLKIGSEGLGLAQCIRQGEGRLGQCSYDGSHSHMEL
jgi:hypothetical protein